MHSLGEAILSEHLLSWHWFIIDKTKDENIIKYLTDIGRNVQRNMSSEKSIGKIVIMEQGQRFSMEVGT